MATRSGPEPRPEPPADAGVAEPEPTIEEVEPVHLLANEAREALTTCGFDDEEIDGWSRAFIAERGGGTVDELLAWIADRERTG